MSDLDIYCSVAANLEESGWSSVLAKLDTETFAKLQAALDTHKDPTEPEEAKEEEEEAKQDIGEAVKQLNAKMTKILKGLKAHRKRFAGLDERLASIESSGIPVAAAAADGAVDAGIGAGGKAVAVAAPKKKRKPKRKLKTMAPEKPAEEEEKNSSSERKHFYRFGYRNLQVLKPTKGYPEEKEASQMPCGKLNLFYAHGYSGNFDESRQNVYLSHDGKSLLYYIAAVAVVYDFKTNKQKFCTLHNDDITTICIAPPGLKKTWAATGQKDPKDVPGQGKDLPKIYIWDYKTTKRVQLIDNVCWGKINRLQWSTASNLLYCVCGDPDQSLKAYDPETFKGAKSEPASLISCNTMREQVLGFEINPRPNKKFTDEFVMFGKRKFCFVSLSKAKNKISAKIKAVSIRSLNKDGEKSFTCAAFLADGNYVVGSQSGSLYIAKGSTALCYVSKAHSKAIGCMFLYDNSLITAGNDKMLRRFAISEQIQSQLMPPGGDSGGGPSTPLPAPSKEDKKETSSGKSGGKGKDSSGKKGDKGKAKEKADTSAKKEKGEKKEKEKGNSNSKGSSKQALTEVWSYQVNVKDSDFVLLPKAMAMNTETGTLFIGSKTNQIVKFEMKEEQSCVIVDGHDGQIWGLCTHPKFNLFATGGYDNAVKVWDASTMKCVFTHEFDKAQGDRIGKQVCCAAWSNNGECLAFGTEDSCVAVFRFKADDSGKKAALELVQMLEIEPKNENAEVEPVSYLRFSADSSLLAAAHMDSNLYIYSVDEKALKMTRWAPMAHVAAPTNIQFSADGKVVKTITRDYEICHWALNAQSKKGKFVPKIPDPDVLKWADDPLIAGWDVQGLYQSGWDGTDLNDATVTSDNKLVVSGDDYGTIRLHNYPAIDSKACYAYPGHAEFVVGVEFLRDDSQLISCGGNDMAIFQWKLKKN